MGKIIDISRHNSDEGPVDFAQIAKEADLVIIRIQYGSNYADPSAQMFIDGCRQYGIRFGVYAYGCFVNEADAIIESDNFYNRTKALAGDDAQFMILDTEEDTIIACGESNVARASQVFIDRLKELGVKKVGFYASHHRLINGDPLGLLNVKADFRWIPLYGPNDGNPHSKPNFPCDLWQYTDVGSFPGIVGNVDLNELSGDKPLSYFTGVIDLSEHTPDQWAEIAWAWAKEHGLVDDTGHPRDDATEQVVVGIIKNMKDREEKIAKENYENQSPSDWAKAEWNWGQEQGIVSKDAGQSHPHGVVTEEILLRVVKQLHDLGFLNK